MEKVRYMFGHLETEVFKMTAIVMGTWIVYIHSRCQASLKMGLFHGMPKNVLPRLLLLIQPEMIQAE